MYILAKKTYLYQNNVQYHFHYIIKIVSLQGHQVLTIYNLFAFFDICFVLHSVDQINSLANSKYFCCNLKIACCIVSKKLPAVAEPMAKSLSRTSHDLHGVSIIDCEKRCLRETPPFPSAAVRRPSINKYHASLNAPMRASSRA
jgi:hypothetical protein